MSWDLLAFQAYLCLCGGALIVAGVRTLFTRVRLWRVGGRVTGTVIGWTTHYETDGTVDGLSPRVQYRARDGSEHELKGTVAGVLRSSPGPTGQAFPVIHDPDAPDRALPGGAFAFWIAPPLLLAFGAFVVWAALVRLPG